MKYFSTSLFPLLGVHEYIEKGGICELYPFLLYYA